MTRAVIAFGANLGDREATIACRDARARRAPTASSSSRSRRSYETAAHHDRRRRPRRRPATSTAVVLVETRSSRTHCSTSLQRHRGRARPRARRALGRPHPRPRPHRLRRARARRRAPRAAAPARRRARVRAAPWLDVDPDAVLPGRGPVAELRARGIRRGGAPMKRTRASTIIAFTLGGLVVGYLARPRRRHGRQRRRSCRRSRSPSRSSASPSSSWPSRWPIRRAVKGKATKHLDPFRAMRIAVLAKACSLSGALVLGRRPRHHAVPLTRSVVPAVEHDLAGARDRDRRRAAARRRPRRRVHAARFRPTTPTSRERRARDHAMSARQPTGGGSRRSTWSSRSSGRVIGMVDLRRSRRSSSSVPVRPASGRCGSPIAIAVASIIGIVLEPRRVRSIGYQLRDDDLLFRRGIMFQRMWRCPTAACSSSTSPAARSRARSGSPTSSS